MSPAAPRADHTHVLLLRGINVGRSKQILSEKNMEHDFTIIDGRATRECYIMIEPEQVSAGSIMLTEKGFHVEEADIKRLFDRIKARVKAEDMVLIAGSLPTNFTIDNLRQLLRILKEIGCFIPHVRCCKTPTLRVGVYGTNLNGR